jgi:hypothetical protein
LEKSFTVKNPVLLSPDIMLVGIPRGSLSWFTIPMLALKGMFIPKIAVNNSSIMTGKAIVQNIVPLSLKNVLISFTAIPIIEFNSLPP